MAVLIDLGTERGLPETDPPPSPGSRRISARWLSGLLSGLLLFAGVTAAAPPTGALRPAGDLDLPAGSTYFVADDLLLVATAPAGRSGTSDADDLSGTLSAYALPGGKRRWTVPVDTAGRHYAELAGDVLLVAELDPVGRRTVTVARSARTGALRWSRPGRVIRVAGSGLGLGVSEVRSVSGAGRRLEGAVEAVELASGQVRWRLPLASTAVVQPVPGDPARVLVVHDDVRARVHDLGTGAPVGAGELPPADYAQSNPWVVGGRLVLRHPAGRDPAVSGYDLPGLTRRWTRPGAGTGEVVRDCAGLACLDGGSRVVALDPATGAQRWSRLRPRGWNSIVRSPDLLIRPDAHQGRSLLAVADGATLRILGVLPPGVVDCRAGAAAVVCRTAPDRLGVWRLTGPA
ncbi:PQQ-binding-like beta-propeller repeat protein [Micromonospora sp. WMMD1102]|uniref:outer membrane protein assembly factor BamB family protein n=1 Tax=Micromonospora sp. WMMD1102 TaxID=3016105 RepID=UPI002414D482|nr:PQQ-binding-like beta-propeller repeat protein [Micromonospora sp. WMMD1102]MDG4788151.1 PQQ-binding-like beta-propeller repeat protein [Micromonospora sp. WMMD1102]